MKKNGKITTNAESELNKITAVSVNDAAVFAFYIQIRLPFYKRCIILNSLVNGRALSKCTHYINSELKVFAKLFSKSGYKGKPSRAGLPLCLRHSPLAERFQGKAFRRLRTSGRNSVPCTLQAFEKA